MSPGNLLTILGIVVTLSFGAWGVFLALSQRRYPGRITFVKEDCIPLFDAIVRNLPELAVLFDGKPVGEGLVLLKGWLVNTGRRDISAGLTEKGLGLILPSDFGWLTARVVEASEDLEANFSVTRKEILLETGLFRCGEHVRFEALAEVPIADPDDASAGLDLRKRLLSALSFDHRIAETGPVASRGLPDDLLYRRRRRRLLPLVGVMAAILLAVGIGASLGFPRALTYEIETGPPHGRIEVRVQAMKGGSIKIKGVSSDYATTMAPREFFAREDLRFSTGIKDRQALLVFLVGGPLYIALVLAMVYFDRWKNRRLRKLLAGPTRPPVRASEGPSAPEEYQEAPPGEPEK